MRIPSAAAFLFHDDLLVHVPFSVLIKARATLSSKKQSKCEHFTFISILGDSLEKAIHCYSYVDKKGKIFVCDNPIVMQN